MRIVIVFSTLAIVFGSHAAFAVDTDADYEVPVSGSLSDAIRAANSNPDNDTYKIVISGSSTESGTIKKSTSITGDSTAAVSGYINFSGTSINSELNNMTFSAGNSPAVTNGEMGLGNAQNLIVNSVVFDQRKGSGFGGSVLNIGNLTIQNGSSFTNNKADYGGAIYHGGTSKTLNISNSSFSGNTATSSGGAINNTGILSVTDSVFEKNHGIYNGGAIITTGKTEIIRTTFNGNKASEGGAIHVGGNNGNLSISDSNFFNNETSINSQGTSDFGGAINAVGKLTINNSRFENNRSTEGGAIKLRQSSAETLITGGNFTKNSALIRDGGAIDQSDGNLTIDGTIFVQNQSLAGDGGAIYTNSELTIKGNAEFSDNSAKTNGGAINAISNSKLNIDGASFFKNHADNGNGGALRIMGNTVLENTVFSENRALKGGGIMNSGFLTIAGGTSFIDNKAAAGGAVYTQGNILLDTSDGNISFRGNQSDNAGGADIYLDPNKNVRIDIEGNTNALSMDSGFSGKGKIYKTGANTLIFEETADNTFFTGDFSQSAGTTHVFADNFFSGTNTVTDGSILHFNKTAQVNNLHLKNGGRLDLRRNGAFVPNTLTVADLISDGSAVVALQTDGTVSDLLKITGSAAGDITLDIDAIGTNPTKNKIEVVETSGAAGDAEFKLSGDKLI